MQTPILIVGAGPAGLSSSIVLSRFGVRSLLVERHPSTSIHPKATGISTRAMELFSAYGIDADGAVLVRPDGHIAWRSTGAAVDPAATLEQVVGRVLGWKVESRRRLVESLMEGMDQRCA